MCFCRNDGNIWKKVCGYTCIHKSSPILRDQGKMVGKTPYLKQFFFLKINNTLKKGHAMVSSNKRSCCNKANLFENLALR